MRVAIIGDSHVAALKAGWDALRADYPNVTVTFFASRGSGLRGLQPRDGALIPSNAELMSHLRFTSGGADRIETAAHDAFVLHGLHCLLDPNAVAMPSVYSSAMAAAVTSAVMMDSLCVTTLRKLRCLCEAPCFVSATPLIVSETAAATPVAPGVIANHARAIQTPVLDDLSARLVVQPVVTIVAPFNTARNFVNGALTLAVGDHRDGNAARDGNLRHMNAAFGRLWMDTFLRDHLAELNAAGLQGLMRRISQGAKRA